MYRSRRNVTHIGLNILAITLDRDSVTQLFRGFERLIHRQI